MFVFKFSLLAMICLACKPKMNAIPKGSHDSHDKNSETINTGLIAISRNSGDSGPDVTDVIIYCIAGTICLAVVKWLKKACKRRLAAVQNNVGNVGANVGAPAPQPQPVPTAPVAVAAPMPMSLPALPAPSYSVVYRAAGHGREEACITEDKMQQYR